MGKSEEEALIVDSHIHLYDPSRPEGVPWPKQDDSIYRTVLPDQFREVAKTAGVTHTVIVEASPWLEDNQWVLDQIRNQPEFLGMIGNLDLSSKEFPAQLERFAADPLFRGVRARGVDNPRLLTEPFSSHLGLLAESDLAIEVMAQGPGMELIARIAEATPDLRFIVDHLGHVAIDGGDPDPVWKSGMRIVAERPNTFCKVSRVIEAAVNWPAPTDPAFYRPVLQHLWDCFGAGRLLWGSNWPVAEKAGDYVTTLSVVQEFLSDQSAEEREQVLWKTSRDVYGWSDRS
jgi:L-fuconolactonase